MDDRETLFFSVRCFIEAVARTVRRCSCSRTSTGPTRGLLDLIELLAARLRDLPIVLLVLARPELLDTRPAGAAGCRRTPRCRCQPLGAEESRKLADELRLEHREPRGRRAALSRRPPRATRSSSSSCGDGRAGASRARAPDATLPTTIRGIVAARLDALPAAERSLLLDAAVVGKMFWRGALERIADDADGSATSSARSSAATWSGARRGRPSRATSSTRSSTC